MKNISDNAHGPHSFLFVLLLEYLPMLWTTIIRDSQLVQFMSQTFLESSFDVSEYGLDNKNNNIQTKGN